MSLISERPVDWENLSRRTKKARMAERRPGTVRSRLSRARETSDVFGREVTGCRRAYDRNGDGVTDYICGSEFVAGDVGVLHGDGTLVEYSCDGLTAQQVWQMVEPTLENKS